MIDSEQESFYTKSDLERVAAVAAQTAIMKMLHAPPNLDNRIAGNDACSSEQEGASNMGSIFRETYSYINEQGVVQSVRFSGKNKRETDAKFQSFLTDQKEDVASPTLREYVDTVYRESFISGLAATTQSNYERYLQSYILPFMGDIQMKEITLSTIQRFYDWLATAKSHGFKQDINKKSIERIGGLLSRILTIATEMRIIRESPFKPKLLRNNGRPAGHHKALPDDDVSRVKKEIENLPSEQQKVYMGFLIYTGLRREEILGLCWNKVHLSEGYGLVEDVVVYPNNNRPVIKPTPKTKQSERTFIIPEPLVDILSQVENKTGYVVHGRDVAKPISMSSFAKMYRKAFTILGIENYNNHDWRTTFGTQMKENGLTSAQVADLMGHADTRMVERVYARTRHEGVMKHKNTLERLNKPYAHGTSVAPKIAG